MRGKLYLSTAFAALALCLSPAGAQSTSKDAAPGARKPGVSESIRTPEAATDGQETKARRDQRAEERSRARADKSSRGKADAADADKTGKAAVREDGKSKKAERDAKKTETDAASEAAKEAARDATKDATTTGAQRRAMDDDDRQGQRERAGRRGETDQNRDATGRSITGQDTTRPGADTRTGQDATRAAPDMRTGQDTSRPGRETARGRDATRGETFGYGGGEAARLDRSQQNQLRNVLENQRDVRRYSRSDVNVRVGAIIPPSVNFYPLPGQIAAILPQYAGYSFFRVDDQYVIVDPGSRQIVSVIGDIGPGGATYGYGYGDEGYYGRDDSFREGGRDFRTGRRDEGYRSAQRDEGVGRRGRSARGDVYGYAAPRVRLDERQERALYRGVMREARSSLRQVCVRVGERVPDSVELEPVPRQIAAEAPDVRRFDYFVLNDQVVLVDPDTRIVADIIEQPR